MQSVKHVVTRFLIPIILLTLLVTACSNPSGGYIPPGGGGGGGGPASAEAPVITGQPQDAVYTKNAAAGPLTVTASVSDGGALSYRWYVNTEDSTTGGTLISGAESASYTPPVDTAGTVYYYVTVTNTIIPDNGDGGVKTRSATSAAAKMQVVAAPLAGAADMAAYLSAAPGGAIPGDPLSLPVNVSLSETGWADLLTAIQAAEKYVALDLSACDMTSMTGTPGEFDPGTADTGESWIVSLVLPDAAESIKAGTSSSNAAFRYFSSLTDITGANVETVGNSAFYNCKVLKTVDLPAAETIGSYAFRYCTALQTLSLPAATSIGNYAFSGCPLQMLSLPAATSIGSSAFYGCTALHTVSLPVATSIDHHAFDRCTALQTLSLPAATSIGSGAFRDCTALHTVSLPASLTSIGDNPFYGCTSLTTITVAAENPSYKAENGKLLSKNGMTLIGYPAASGVVTLEGITSIGGSAFEGCTALHTVSLPAATSIGGSAFEGCTALHTVSLPAATTIDGYAFSSTRTADLTVTLGAAAPALGINMFGSGSTAKTVTVRVPSGATGYGTVPATYSGTGTAINWGNGFRGGGWTGSAMTDSVYINSGITLTVTAY